MVYVPFIVTTRVIGSWVFGEIVCKLSHYLLYVFGTISVYILVMMSLDRYQAIVHPITSKKFRTRQIVNLIVFLIWLVVSGSYLPVIFETNEFDVSETSECTYSTILAASELLAYANSCTNPILYTFLSTKYKVFVN
ncbi:allatostatin-A receptor-like [Mytilus edulis]|uniref:allatostatin-A receptor-like n=1 Tax=Mytilus edulis TaxID=6550 RepID=UPI0039F12EB2